MPFSVASQILRTALLSSLVKASEFCLRPKNSRPPGKMALPFPPQFLSQGLELFELMVLPWAHLTLLSCSSNLFFSCSEFERGRVTHPYPRPRL